MEKINKLRVKKVSIVEAMRSLLDVCELQQRTFTEDEKSQWAAYEKQIAEIDETIAREEAVAKAHADLSHVDVPFRGAPAIIGKAENDEEFRSLGEFLFTVRFNPTDKRLKNTEYREMSVKEGTQGGYMVPTQFKNDLMSVQPQDAIFRPRATVLPAGSPPDASITIPALDQATTKNMYAGVTVTWIAEGGAKQETNAYLREVTLTPHEVAAYITVTDKLLRNWPAAEALIGRQLRLAMTAAEDSAFLSGNGVGKPEGITVAPARISYTRAGANAISYADCYNMYSRSKQGGSYTWVASPTVLPQLFAMKDDSSALVWQPNARDGKPGTLLGVPVLFNDRSPALGVTGDLILADLSYYLIKDGSGPFVEASPHVYFTSNKTVIKAFWNVDGQSWLEKPLTLEGASTATVSPFVVLSS